MAPPPRSPKSPCEDNPCENGGSCSPNGPTGFKCFCDKDFVGVTCTDRVNLCDLEQPCGQDAACVATPVVPFYRCLCPFNQGGPTCTEKLTIEKRVGFNGNSFAGWCCRRTIEGQSKLVGYSACSVMGSNLFISRKLFFSWVEFGTGFV